MTTTATPEPGKKINRIGLEVQPYRGGKTTSVMTILYASKEARDGAAATGMTDGMEAGYQRLDEVLSGLS